MIIPALLAQGCRLDAVLVLRIQGGNDIFCSIAGAYAPSFFGVALPTLAGLPRYDPHLCLRARTNLKAMNLSFQAYAASWAPARPH